MAFWETKSYRLTTRKLLNYAMKKSVKIFEKYWEGVGLFLLILLYDVDFLIADP